MYVVADFLIQISSNDKKHMPNYDFTLAFVLISETNVSVSKFLIDFGHSRQID